MKYAFLISRRYMFSKNKQNIVSKITTIAIITTAISIMMPLLMLSLMNGFHDSIKSALMQNEFHLVVMPYVTYSEKRVEDKNWYRELREEGKENKWYERHIEELKEVVWKMNEKEQFKGYIPSGSRFEDLPRLLEKRDDKLVQSVVPFVEGEGLIKTALEWKPIAIKGFTEDINNSKSFNENIEVNAGDFDFKKDHKIMLGKELAKSLKVDFDRVGEGKGQFVDIVTDVGESDNIDPRIMTHQVASIFTSGYMEIDGQVVFMTAKRSKYLLDKEQYSGIGIQLKDYVYIDEAKEVLEELILENDIEGYVVRSGTARWTAQFRAFDWEKRLIFFVVGIMILASFLTIFITLNILVINKKEEIGILRSMGTNANTTRLIFIMQGFLIGFLGGLIGVVLGVFFTSSINEIAEIGQWLVNFFLEGLYHTPLYDLFGISIQPGDFNIIESSSVLTGSKVNYAIYINDIMIVLSGSLFTSLLAALFASSRATKQNIVDVIRYE